MKFRWINRYEPGRRLIRLCSVLWGKEAGDPGHRRRLSVSLHPVLFRFHRECGARDYGAWSLTILGLRLHYKTRPHGVLV